MFAHRRERNTNNEEDAMSASVYITCPDAVDLYEKLNGRKVEDYFFFENAFLLANELLEYQEKAWNAAQALGCNWGEWDGHTEARTLLAILLQVDKEDLEEETGIIHKKRK